jgi:sugar phosphate isomerase/epimerase
MRVSITDWAHVDEAVPVALAHHVGIEIQEYCNPDTIDSDGDSARAIAEKIRHIPLRGFHGPFSELVPASRDRKIREVTRDRFQSAYELARIIGAQHLVLHTGYIPKTYPRDRWIENSVAFWVDFLSDKRGGMGFHLENVYEDGCSMMTELLDTVNEALHTDALTACLDVGHVGANSSHSFEEWIEGLGGRIRYVHLHNNDGVLDDHFGLWRGKIDVVNVLDLLMKHSPDAVWTIETIPADVERSILWLKERGYITPKE